MVQSKSAEMSYPRIGGKMSTYGAVASRQILALLFSRLSERFGRFVLFALAITLTALDVLEFEINYLMDND